MKNKWLIKYTLNTFIGVLMIIGIPLRMYSQFNIGGEPYSFKYELVETMLTEVMPPIDIDRLMKEDETDAQNGLPYRFGYGFKVEFNLNNSGKWVELNNGDRIWRLKIKSSDARSINLTYDHFWLPKGAVLHVYSPDKSQIIGGFTMQNNKGQKNDKRGFATSFIKDEQIILEYYEPANVTDEGVISINKVVHGYRQLEHKDFGDSGDCQVNINCEEGADWQEEKRAVALMVVDGTRWCTGSLINNTCGDFDPLFLTADHCFNSSGLDAVTNNVGDILMFLWDYESDGCDNSNTEPSFFTTSGASVLANDNSSDFALLRLNEDPANLGSGFVPYYAGWDRSGILNSDGVGIHHPSGDIKKIATHTMIPTGSGGVAHGPIPHWLEVYWDATTNGHSVTEGGSSGSPIFDSNHRVLGQLYGGSTLNCSDPANDRGVYGAISWSWDNDGATDNRRRLRDWLDPCNSGFTLVDGIALGGNCVTTLTHIGIITSGLYEASNSITSTGVIGANQNVTYDAGNFISLNPGFEADASNENELTFFAITEGCGGMYRYDQHEDKKDGLADNMVSIKNYPNPFTEQTTIEFTLSKDTPVTLSISDAMGRQVAMLVSQAYKLKGVHHVTFDGSNYPAGMYYCTIQAGEFFGTQKMILIK